MKIFIGMETSGMLRRRFLALGHDVVSCDLLPADDGECRLHIRGDVFRVLDDASKATCLWMIGDPPPPILKPTKRTPGRIVEWPRGSGKFVERWSNQTDSGQNCLSPGDDRWKTRSKTFPGIADALTKQLVSADHALQLVDIFA